MSKNRQSNKEAKEKTGPDTTGEESREEVKKRNEITVWG